MIRFEHIDLKCKNNLSFFYYKSAILAKNGLISDCYHVEYEKCKIRTYLVVLVRYNKLPVYRWELPHLRGYKLQRYGWLLNALLTRSNVS